MPTKCGQWFTKSVQSLCPSLSDPPISVLEMGTGALPVVTTQSNCFSSIPHTTTTTTIAQNTNSWIEVKTAILS